MAVQTVRCWKGGGILMPKIVPGFGPRDAKIALVGEAPGEQEEIDGRPFVGSAGHLLSSMLSSAGIPRDMCYLTNVMKIRPPHNDFGAFYHDTERTSPTQGLLDGQSSLAQELQSLSPNITVALGGEALRALTGRMGITKWRGSILATSVGKVIGTFHPAAI